MSQPQDLSAVAQASEKTLAHFDEKNPAPLDAKDEVLIRIPDPSVGSYRHIAGAIPAAAWLIVLNEFCERFAYYGASNTFQNYVQDHMGKDQSVATALSNYFTFFTYFTPIIGAIFADQIWGKFRTILTFSIVYLVGWVILFGSSINETDAQFPLYIVSITIIGLGAGGIKSVVSPFCADQIPEEPYVIEKKGQKYIVDPDLTVQHLYNWFYWSINIGALLGQSICTTLERSAFWKAYLLPSCMFIVAIAVFVSGKNKYVHVPPRGSVILESFKCTFYALRRSVKYRGKVAIPPEVENYKFLEYAKPIDGESAAEVHARTWDDNFTVELRQTLKAVPVLFSLTIYWISYNQMLNNLISQAGQMKRPSWLSNDLINILDPLVLVIVIPIFDYLIYPTLDKKGIHFGYMKRIAVGFFLGGVAMAWSAVVQAKIYEAPPYFDYTGDIPDDADGNDISVWWQVPAYIFIAMSEIFASIASLEYSYTHAPRKMKAFISALSLLPNALASLIGIFISPFSTDPHITWVYTSVAIACGISTPLFYFTFRRFDEEDRKMYEAKRNANRLAADQGLAH